MTAKLSIDVVPVRLRGTVAEALAMVDRPEGVTSAWGDFRAEGLVGRPLHGLCLRDGRRLTVKLKSKDFDAIRGDR